MKRQYAMVGYTPVTYRRVFKRNFWSTNHQSLTNQVNISLISSYHETILLLQSFFIHNQHLSCYSRKGNVLSNEIYYLISKLRK